MRNGKTYSQKRRTTFSLCELPYSPDQIDGILTGLQNCDTCMQQKTQYLNIPCAFDTETTSFIDSNGNKAGTVYCWTLGLNGKVIFGRTYTELMTCMHNISDRLQLGKMRRLVIYVHNLAFDFQFFRHLFHWENIFSLDTRKPLYALSDLGIEFRCSYLLSGYGLEKLGEHLTRYPVHKLVGDLDYKLIRNCDTPMTEQEIQYCVNDVLVVMSYIQERIEIDGSIARIPLTKTGYVRKRCRNACLYSGSHKKNTEKYHKYMTLMHGLTLEPWEYRQLKRAFQGGFTHANAWKSCQIWEHVRSYDFTSSYPAVMVCEKFPMSKGQHIQITSKEEFEKNIHLYCCLFDIRIEGLQGIESVEHPISLSKCRNIVKPITNNGRVVSADALETTITEVDYLVLTKFYKWDRIAVKNFIRYKKMYLPTPLVDEIMRMYENKTKLKGVAGMEQEYQSSKADVNSAYGMMVTDICRDLIIYDNDTNEWGEPEPPDIATAINKYNTNKRRFLFYPWGVWVTSYARRNLFTGIREFGNDYIYSDTDSVKVLNYDKHTDYINLYNQIDAFKMRRAMEYHGFPADRWKPKTIKDVEKPLGFWDDEGEYTAFKTLGAKRYMTEQDGNFSITVSGINKKIAVPYMMHHFVFQYLAEHPDQRETARNLMFNAFADSLYIPPEYTGKNCHTYIDEPCSGHLTDYLGITAPYSEMSCIHLGAADYSLSLSRYYIDFMLHIKQIEE